MPVQKSQTQRKFNSSTRKEVLPCWNLEALYKGLDDPRIIRDLKNLAKRCEILARTCKGKLQKLSVANFALALQEYEALCELSGKLSAFAFLKHAENLNQEQSSQFRQNLQEQLTEIGKHIIFFPLELNRIDRTHLHRCYQTDQSVARYKPWIEAERRFKPYQLSDDVETILMEKSLTSQQAWVTLYDESEAALRFAVGGRSLTLSETLHLLSDKSRAARRSAAKALGAELKEKSPLFTTIINTLAQDKALEDRRRGFPSPIAARNLCNRIAPRTVEALVEAVKASYPRLSHRYYRLKARWMKRPFLESWDRSAPVAAVEDRIPWRKACEVVQSAYSSFSPQMGEVVEKVFANSWIDAQAREGKMSGAFSHPTVTAAHPVILMTYHGKNRDVMTLAHEMGHTVHQVLAARQGYLLSHTPLTLAETASVFGEMLVFEQLLAQAHRPAARRALLASKIEDMLNTVVRQISFLEFELRVHEMRRSKPLTRTDLCDLWMQTSRESLGDIFRFDDNYRYYWGYISHFVHAPFYVYAYAFGECLVNVLYAQYKAGRKDFEKHYLELLRAGGAQDYPKLLRKFDLNADRADFWTQGLAVIEDMIDRLDPLIP